MKEEILRILEMEKQGKLTTEQAAELLAALVDESQGERTAFGGGHTFRKSETALLNCRLPFDETLADVNGVS